MNCLDRALRKIYTSIDKGMKHRYTQIPILQIQEKVQKMQKVTDLKT